MRQVNFRASEELIAAVEAAAGSQGRNGWLVAAAREKLERDGGAPVALSAAPVVTGNTGPEAVPVVTPPSRPMSERAPYGCRVAGPGAKAARALAAAPEVEEPIPGQIDLEEALTA